MKKLKLLTFLTIFLTLIATLNQTFAKEKRIISIGGSITEILFEIGEGENIIGVDTTSTYPKKVKNLKQVGYQRALSAEGILSLNPDLIILTSDAGPDSTINKIKSQNIEILELKSPKSLETLKNNIKIIGSKLNQDKKANKLISKIISKNQELEKQIKKSKTTPKIVFIMTHGNSPLMTAGKNTAADSIIKISGAKNIISNYSSYKILTPESLVALDPDFVLTTNETLKQIGSKSKLLRNKAFKLTKIKKKSQIIAFDSDYLLSFSPRIIDAASDLNKEFNK